jgi:hypothetical protein
MRQFTKNLIVVLGLSGICSGNLLAEDPIPQPSNQASAAQSADPNSIRDAVLPLLKTAELDDKSAPELISNQIKALTPKIGDDPRLHYLHGLVLLKNFRHAEAIAAMRAGADHKIYCFPIHRVLIYEQVREKKYDEAIEGLLDLSARIGDPGQLWTSEDDRLEAAHWLGRMTVYLAGPCGDQAIAALMNQTEPVIRSQLPDVYQSAMDEGATELHAEHRALQVLLLAKVDESAAKKADLLKEGEQQKLKLDTQKKELSTYEREKSAVQEEELKEVDGQLASLEKQYVQLQRTHDQIVSAIASLRIQIATTPRPEIIDSAPVARMSPAGLNTLTNALNSPDSPRVMKELELQGYIVELNQNVLKQADVVKKAEAQVAQRQQLLSQLHAETRRSQDAAHNLRRWERRLSLSQKKVKSEGDRNTVAVKTRISQLSTYDSIQPQAELSQLALSLGIEP